MPSARILVADDDRSIRSLLRSYLCSYGYDVQEATNGQETMDAITRGPRPEIILLDLSMPAPEGMELLHRLHNMVPPPRPCAIVMTGNGSVPCAVRAMQLGAIDFLEKPFAPPHLLTVIKRALGQTASAASITYEEPKTTLGYSRRRLNDGDVDKAERQRLASDRYSHKDADYFRLLALWYLGTDRPAKAMAAFEQAAHRANKCESLA